MLRRARKERKIGLIRCGKHIRNKNETCGENFKWNQTIVNPHSKKTCNYVTFIAEIELRESTDQMRSPHAE